MQQIVFPTNQNTLAKWKKRTSVTDVQTGPTEPSPTVLAPCEEAIVVAFRWHTLRALDACLYTLQPTVPHLSRAALHRSCHGTGLQS